MNFESNTGGPSINEAAIRIAALEAEAQSMGANDFEMLAFRRIQERLEAGNVSPLLAVKEADGIVKSKSAYH